MVSAGRGQLILVGAIAMALIVIGLVLVINTALFTDVVGSEGTVEGAKGAGVASEEIEDSVGQVVHEENLEETNPNDNTIRGNVEDELEPTLLNSSLDGSGAYLNVEYDGTNDDGTYIYQTTTTSFPSSWTVPGGITTDVGYFDLGIETDTGDVTVQVEGADSNTRDVDIDGGTSGEVTFSGSAVAGSCTADGVGSFLWVDLYHGADRSGQCNFDLFHQLEAPYEITITDSDGGAEGQYRMVVEQDVTCTDCTNAVWTYDLTYTYETIEVTAEAESEEVPVYD